MTRQNDRMETMLSRLRSAHMCAIPSDVLITVQESIRTAHRMLSLDEMDVTAASMARNAIKAAREAMDSYSGERQ